MDHTRHIGYSRLLDGRFSMFKSNGQSFLNDVLPKIRCEGVNIMIAYIAYTMLFSNSIHSTWYKYMHGSLSTITIQPYNTSLVVNHVRLPHYVRVRNAFMNIHATLVNELNMSHMYGCLNVDVIRYTKDMFLNHVKSYMVYIDSLVLCEDTTNSSNITN